MKLAYGNSNIAGKRNMSFQSNLDEAHNIGGGNVAGDINVTDHKFPMQIVGNSIQKAPYGSQAVYGRSPFPGAYRIGAYTQKMYLQGRCDLVQRRIKLGRTAIFSTLWSSTEACTSNAHYFCTSRI